MNGRPSTVNLNTTPLRPTTAVDDVSRSVDELLRRTLRIGDPNNPAELADALRRHYSAQAARLDQESLGLPVSPGATLDLMIRAEAPQSGASPIERESERVRCALETDLDYLINHAANREWRPELQGWRSSILREFADATAAAGFSQDPAQRDRAMLGVRKLAEYARMSRLLSVLHYELRREYRRSATTLDESSSTLRIRIGQSLYSAGLSEGGLLLNVPLMDLRNRSTALIESLRALTEGTSTPQVGIEDRGNRFVAYREVLKAIDDQGAAELRVYLRESSLQQHLDSILDGVGSASTQISAEGLRNLASTLPAEISRIQRLYELVGGVVARFAKDWQSMAELSRFHQALGLFIHALISLRAGERLVDLAVPLAMNTRQVRQGDEGRERLRKLVAWRAEFARQADTHQVSHENTLANRMLQAQIDRALFDFDRAIDLYALGSGSTSQWGQHEIHAVSAAEIFEHLVEKLADRKNDAGLAGIASSAAKLLSQDIEISDDMMTKLLEQQATTEAHWHSITRKQAPPASGSADIRQACLDLIRGETRKKPKDPEWPIPGDLDSQGQPINVDRRSTQEPAVPMNRLTPIVAMQDIQRLSSDLRDTFCFLNTAILALSDLQYALKDPTQQITTRWDAWHLLLAGDKNNKSDKDKSPPSKTEPQGLPGFKPWSEIQNNVKPDEVKKHVGSFLLWEPGDAAEQEILLWTSRLIYCLTLILSEPQKAIGYPPLGSPTTTAEQAASPQTMQSPAGNPKGTAPPTK